MIRLTPAQATRLHEFMTDLQNNFKDHPNNTEVFDDAWDETKEALAQQLGSPDHAEDLLDTVYGYLVSNGTRPIVGDHLKRLQKAVLLPNELRKLKDSVIPNTCAGCSSVLGDYEAIVYINNALYCIGCYAPQTLAVLDRCRIHSSAPRTQEFPIKIVKQLQKAVEAGVVPTCPECEAERQRVSGGKKAQDPSVINLPSGQQVSVAFQPTPRDPRLSQPISTRIAIPNPRRPAPEVAPPAAGGTVRPGSATVRGLQDSLDQMTATQARRAIENMNATAANEARMRDLEAQMIYGRVAMPPPAWIPEEANAPSSPPGSWGGVTRSDSPSFRAQPFLTGGDNAFSTGNTFSTGSFLGNALRSTTGDIVGNPAPTPVDPSWIANDDVAAWRVADENVAIDIETTLPPSPFRLPEDD